MVVSGVVPLRTLETISVIGDVLADSVVVVVLNIVEFVVDNETIEEVVFGFKVSVTICSRTNSSSNNWPFSWERIKAKTIAIVNDHTVPSAMYTFLRVISTLCVIGRTTAHSRSTAMNIKWQIEVNTKKKYNVKVTLTTLSTCKLPRKTIQREAFVSPYNRSATDRLSRMISNSL